MKRLVLIIGIAFSLDASVALAQHENMPGHDSMDGGHAGMPMPSGKDSKPEKKKSETDKKQPSPKPGNQN